MTVEIEVGYKVTGCVGRLVSRQSGDMVSRRRKMILATLCDCHYWLISCGLALWLC